MEHRLFFNRFLLFALFIVSHFHLPAQKTWYVKSGAGGDNSGSSWGNAFIDLHFALSKAGSGDQVWIAAGRYSPGPARTDYFELKSGVKIYGGFEGTENSVAQRDLSKNKTVFDGNIGDPADSSDNSNTLLYVAYPDKGTLINGVTFQHAHAVNDTVTDFFSPLLNGGAVFIWMGDSTAYIDFEHCTFKKNKAKRWGGAVACIGSAPQDGGFPLFRHCLFEGNEAGLGAAVFAKGGSQRDAGRDYYDCTFLNNTTLSRGTLYYEQNFGIDRLELVKCYAKNNKASSGSFLHFKAESVNYAGLLVDSCEITECIVGNPEGCAIEVLPIWYPIKEKAYFKFTNCYIHHNGVAPQPPPFPTSCQALIGFWGQDGFTNKDTTIIENNVFEHNKAVSCLTFGATFGYSSLQYNIFRHNKYQLTPYKTIEPCIIGYIKNVRYNVFDSNNQPALYGHYGNNTVGDDISHNLFVNNKIEIPKDINSTYSKLTLLGTDILKNIKFHIFNNLFINNVINSDKVFNGLYRDTLYSTNNIYYNNYNAFDSTLSLPLPLRYDTVISRYDLMDPDMKHAQLPFLYDELTNKKGIPEFGDTSNYNFRLLPCSPGIGAGSIWPLSEYGIKSDFAGNLYIENLNPDMGPFITPPPTLKSTPITKGVCRDDSIGTVFFDVEGFCPPLSYLWSNGKKTGYDTVGLSAGNYSFTIFDKKGRKMTHEITIPRSDISASISGLPYTCFGQNTGMLEAAQKDGIAPVKYLWNNEEITAKVTDLLAGTYTVTLTDAVGCITTSSKMVIDVPVPVWEEKIIKTSTPTAKDGSLSVKITSGGLPPFRYLWSTGDTSETISNLRAGFYSLVITDAAGCGYALNYKVDAMSDVVERHQDQYAVMPNPAHDQLLILSGPADHITLYDVNGIKMLEQHLATETTNTLSIADLPRGIYLYCLRNSHNKQIIFYGRILIQ